MILDIGPKSVARLIEVLKTCKTVLWNGPLGAFEIAPFGEGTFAVTKEVARLTKSGAMVSVAGGGDTVAAPSIWPFEIANVVTVAERRRIVKPAQAAAFFQTLGQLSIAVDRAEIERIFNAVSETARRYRLARPSRKCATTRRSFWRSPPITSFAIPMPLSLPVARVWSRRKLAAS